MSSISKKKEEREKREERKNKDAANSLLFLSVAFRISDFRGRGWERIIRC